MRADGSEFPVEMTITRTGRAAEPAFTGYVRDITERQRAEQELKASRARLVAASDAARQRVTRDLHDGAQQRFVTTLINLQLAEQKWESAPRARAGSCSAWPSATPSAGSRTCARSPRESIRRSSPSAASPRPSTPRRQLADPRPARRARLQAPGPESRRACTSSAPKRSPTWSSTPTPRPPGCGWNLIDDRCAVEVRDDGIGGARPRSETSGLNGLRDRIGALNGTMDISSPATGGTVLKASIPLPLTRPSAIPPYPPLRVVKTARPEPAIRMNRRTEQRRG